MEADPTRESSSSGFAAPGLRLPAAVVPIRCSPTTGARSSAAIGVWPRELRHVFCRFLLNRPLRPGDERPERVGMRREVAVCRPCQFEEGPSFGTEQLAAHAEMSPALAPPERSLQRPARGHE